MKAGRRKLPANEKCPHVNRKTRKPDCGKMGRLGHNPIVSWDTMHKNGKKRYYYQFIHEDGTRHNVETEEQHFLNEIKGHPLEAYILGFYDAANKIKIFANALHIVANASRTPEWGWKDGEEERLINALDRWDFEPLITKYKSYSKRRGRKIYKESQEANDQKYYDYDPDERERINKLTERVFQQARFLENLYPNEDPKTILTLAVKKVLGIKEAEFSTSDDLKKVIRRRYEQGEDLLRRVNERIAEMKLVEVEIKKVNERNK